MFKLTFNALTRIQTMSIFRKTLLSTEKITKLLRLFFLFFFTCLYQLINEYFFLISGNDEAVYISSRLVFNIKYLTLKNKTNNLTKTLK